MALVYVMPVVRGTYGNEVRLLSGIVVIRCGGLCLKGKSQAQSILEECKKATCTGSIENLSPSLLNHWGTLGTTIVLQNF